ncbi:hypothetical protein ACFFRR_008658 [Megaselia abdita]
MLGPLVNTVYFVGVTLGALICSTICDLWGRRKLVYTCLYAQAVMAVGLYYAPSLEVFMFFRFLQGFFIQGVQTCSYTLMLEYCPSKYRTAAAVFWESMWAIGLGLLGVVSFYIRDWRTVSLVVLAPTIISLTYSWMFPESITWLYAKDKSNEALFLLKKLAKSNNNHVVLEKCNEISLDRNQNDLLSEEKGEVETKDTGSSLTVVLRSKVLKKHLFTMIGVWFSVTLSYYGILFFLPNLAGERHVNFLVGAAIELLAYILAYFVLANFGRRIPMAFYQYSNGVLIFVMGLLSMMEESPAQKWSLIVIALIAKGLAVSSFGGMFIYCSELFPTVCRGIALGLCGFSARCGSLLAPQLMAMMLFMPNWIPLSLMSILLLIAATSTLFLPETLTSQLPNTVDEAEELWANKRK